MRQFCPFWPCAARAGADPACSCNCIKTDPRSGQARRGINGALAHVQFIIFGALWASWWRCVCAIGFASRRLFGRRGGLVAASVWGGGSFCAVLVMPEVRAENKKPPVGRLVCYSSSLSRVYFLNRITSIPSQSFSSLKRSCSGVSSLRTKTFAAFSTSPIEPTFSGLPPIS